MIRLTKKADYAVFIMTYLARKYAGAGGASAEVGPTLGSAQELASFSALNKSLVANLLKDLARAGLLGSVRGARGGYHLARNPDAISLAQILAAVEGPFSLVGCVAEGAAPAAVDHGGECECALSPLCTSRGPLNVLHDRIARMLAGLKLDELSGILAAGANSARVPACSSASIVSASNTSSSNNLPTESPR